MYQSFHLAVTQVQIGSAGIRTEIQLRIHDSGGYTLHNATFGFPYRLGPSFSTPALWCRIIQSCIFTFQSPRVFSINTVSGYCELQINAMNVVH